VYCIAVISDIHSYQHHISAKAISQSI